MERKSKNVWAVEMSCPWIQNWEKKSEEKTAKYGPLRFELKKQTLAMKLNNVTSSLTC